MIIYSLEVIIYTPRDEQSKKYRYIGDVTKVIDLIRNKPPYYGEPELIIEFNASVGENISKPENYYVKLYSCSNDLISNIEYEVKEIYEGRGNPNKILPNPHDKVVEIQKAGKKVKVKVTKHTKTIEEKEIELPIYYYDCDDYGNESWEKIDEITDGKYQSVKIERTEWDGYRLSIASCEIDDSDYSNITEREFLNKVREYELAMIKLGLINKPPE